MSSSHQHDNTQALFELWVIFRRHFWRFFLPAVLVAVMVLVIGLILPRKYRAEAHFERSTDLALSEMTDRGASDAFKDSRGQITLEINSNAAISNVLRKLDGRLREMGVVQGDEDLKALARDVARKVVPHWELRTPESDRVRLEYTGSHPIATKLIVNGLVEHYIETTRQSMEDRLTRSSEFFQQELARHRAKLDALESEVLKFEIEYGELLPEHPYGLQSRIAEAQNTVTELVARRESIELKIDAIIEELSKEPVFVQVEVMGPNPELARLEGELRELRSELAEMTTVYKMTDAHPDIQIKNKELARLRLQAQEIPPEVVTSRTQRENPKRSELELRLSDARADNKALSEQIKAYKGRIDLMGGETDQMYAVRSQYRKLTRETSQAQRQINFWQDNLRRVDMALTADTNQRGVQLKFLSPANASSMPISPNLFQVYTAAFILAIGAGVLSVFFAHRSDESFSSQDELGKNVSIPILGSVGELISQRQMQIRRLRNMVLYPGGVTAAASVVMAVGFVLYLDLEHPEKLHKLKQQHLPTAEQPAQAQETPEAPRTPYSREDSITLGSAWTAGPTR